MHGDVNSKNLLVDPDSLHVTGVVDWEFAHSGSPYADLGNLLRFDRAPALIGAVLEARGRLVHDQGGETLALARAADLSALVDLAVHEHESPVAAHAADLLRTMVAAGDLHAC